MDETLFVAEKEDRLDKILVQLLQKSRNQIEKLIKKGYVHIDGKTALKPGIKIQKGQKISIIFPQPADSMAKEVDFDIEVIYEDEYILVVNKPPGVVVHPAPSYKEATLVDWLKRKGVRLSTLSGEERHGIVHRIDKETSGLLVVAKSNEAHQNLAKQLQSRQMGRYYLAIITPPLKEHTVVDKAIGRNPKNRLKMAVVEGAKEAKSAFAKLLKSKDGAYELIAAKLFSGRTHQIRVHLASLHRHILGDSLYGFKSKKVTIPRVFLHAYILYLEHPIKKERMQFVASVPQDMQKFIEQRFERELIDEKIDPNNFARYFDFSHGLWHTASTSKA